MDRVYKKQRRNIIKMKTLKVLCTAAIAGLGVAALASCGGSKIFKQRYQKQQQLLKRSMVGRLNLLKLVDMMMFIQLVLLVYQLMLNLILHTHIQIT